MHLLLISLCSASVSGSPREARCSKDRHCGLIDSDRATPTGCFGWSTTALSDSTEDAEDEVSTKAFFPVLGINTVGDALGRVDAEVEGSGKLAALALVEVGAAAGLGNI